MARRSQNPKVLAIVLAGGEGKRLMPLTADRAKPAVPFGGIYRLIDFALSNVVNSGYLKVVVLTQYKSHSLDKHVTATWRMSTLLGNYVAPVPAQQRVGKDWFLGSADAIFQCLNLIHDEQPDIVVVVGADHVYRMDFSQMVDQHVETGAGVTVAAIRQPISLADQFGVIEVDDDDPHKIGQFLEKPKNPKGLADSPDEVLASMGNYVFDADVLVDAVTRDHELEGTKHDMGGDIVPAFVSAGEGYVYDFKDNEVPGATERDRGYWRDVGTIDAYFEANMDLISIHPVFNLYNYEWPIYTSTGYLPPAKFVHGHGRPRRRGAELGGLPRCRHLRRAGPRLGAGAAGQGAQLRDDRRQRHPRQRRGRPLRHDPARHRRQVLGRARARHDRDRPRPRPGPRVPRERQRHRRRPARLGRPPLTPGPAQTTEPA